MLAIFTKSLRGCAQVTPRGVQLVLGTAQQPRVVDTLVMANLAYFQLKAAPGAFHLSLAPGRSRQLYTVDDPGAPGQVTRVGYKLEAKQESRHEQAH